MTTPPAAPADPRLEDLGELPTIPQALQRAARSAGGITFVDRDLHARHLPYPELAAAAARAASGLRARGVGPGDRVCLLGPTSPELVVALFGAWRAGAIPAVLPLPRRRFDLQVYLDDLTARTSRVGASLLGVAGALAGQGFALSELPIPLADLADLAADPPLREPLCFEADQPALLQFTSGTTAQARAVCLTHRNVLSNLLGAGAALGVGPGDVIVSWLPLFHDLGLIGMLLGAVVFALPLVLLPTEEFLGRPGSWLDAISRFGGTISASPNFGYGLAARDLTSRPRPLDLRSWRLAANGAEPIDHQTLEAFLTAACPYGLPPTAPCPMYGLAEATLAVTVCAPGDPVRVTWVDRHALEAEGRAVPAPPSEAARPLVCCGNPLPATQVEIRSPEGRRCEAGVVGEIVVRGPGVMAGYWQDPGATGEVLEEGWLRTGDLGFWGPDGLVVCGRLKDVVILGGRNLYPEDYEQWAERVPGVRRGNVVAFAAPGAERMVVVAETTAPPADAASVARRALELLRRVLPLGPQEVVLVPPGTLPKTSSGKRQRAACRQRYVSGQLPALAVARR